MRRYIFLILSLFSLCSFSLNAEENSNATLPSTHQQIEPQKSIEEIEKNFDALEKWQQEAIAKEAAQDAAMGSAWSKMISSLLTLLIIFVVFAYIAKRLLPKYLQKSPTTARAQIIERTYIAPKTSISIISVDNEEYTIYETQHSSLLLRSQQKTDPNK